MTQIPLPTAQRVWWFFLAAAATFVPAVGYHYVGEEAIFPISSLEMWYRGEWIQKTLYGYALYHTPLFNWLIIAGASVAGWEHMLAVARVITIAATLLAGLLAGWLARALGADRALAAFCALVYLTLADVFFYRGWLAYVDPLFGMFTAAAAAVLWAACARGRPAWLFAAAALLALALLAKSLTAYVFYALAALVLFLADRRHRAVLLAPASWCAHALALAFPFVWVWVVPGTGRQGARFISDITAKLAPTDVVDYLVKLVAFPAETALRLFPALLLVAWYLWRGRTGLDGPAAAPARLALGIALVNFLPYWLAPEAAMRYLLPLFPFVALGFAWLLWGAGAPAVRVAERWIGAAIALKAVLALVVFPLYQAHYRGAGYEAIARDVLARSAGHPLYVSNDSASGLAVAAHLDILRLPAAPVTFPPPGWTSGFVLAYAPDEAVGPVVARYRVGSREMVLLCRGAACGGATR